MYKIRILFLDREFEHDVYELIRAFYPESEIHTIYEEEAGQEEYNLSFTVSEENGSFVLRYKGEGHNGVTSAEKIKGHSCSQEEDAPVFCKSEEESDRTLRKENKDIIKYGLYKLLVKLTGRTLPWGNLTGIRPVKLAMAMIESGMKNSETAQEMRERYLVSPEKTALAVAIANRERDILKKIDYEKGYSLYIGVPFCPSICLYCSFSSYPLNVWKDRVDAYVDALCREIRETAPMMTGRKLDTIYIGGGLSLIHI